MMPSVPRLRLSPGRPFWVTVEHLGKEEEAGAGLPHSMSLRAGRCVGGLAGGSCQPRDVGRGQIGEASDGCEPGAPGTRGAGSNSISVTNPVAQGLG